eukprot:SAG31_NODE_4641_length_3078_cov_5.138301_2_plen_47_part_00
MAISAAATGRRDNEGAVHMERKHVLTPPDYLGCLIQYQELERRSPS